MRDTRALPVVISLAAAGSLLAMAPASLRIGYDRFALPKELASTCLALTAALVALRATPVRQVMRLAWTDLCIVGFVALCALSLAFAPNHWLGWRSASLTASAVAIWLAARAAGPARRWHVVAGLAGVAIAGALVVLVESHTRWLQLSMHGRAAGGTEGNRNFMAHMLALAIPCTMALCWRARSKRWMIAAAVGLAAVVWAIALSRCRTAWLATMVGTAAMAIGLGLRQSRALATRRVRVLAIAAAIAGGIACAIAVPNRLTWSGEQPYVDTLARVAEYDKGTGHGRLVQYRNTLVLVRMHPWLGVGPGNWSVRYPMRTSAPDPNVRFAAVHPINRLPNTDWLGFAAERGLPATLLLLAFLIGLGGSTWRATRACRDPDDVARGACVVATLSALAVLGTFDAVLLRPTPSLVAFGLLGALASRPQGGIEIGIPARFPRIAQIATLATMVWFAITDGRFLAAGLLAGRGDIAALNEAANLAPDNYCVHARLAVSAERRGHCDTAGVHARAALRAFPGLPVARTVLERCRRRL